MKNLIRKVPVPLCGVMLGTAALGNLLQSYSEGIRLFCGVIAACLLVLAVLKLICFPGMVREDMKNPIMASVACTFPMALMLLSVYIKPFLGTAAYAVWLAAIILHGVLILYFTVKFLLHLQFPKVFASYYIVYVGIAAAAVTAPAYQMEASVGIGTFWFGLVSFVILLVFVTYRYIRFREVPAPAKPLICIYAAPASLCLAGYTQSASEKSVPFLMILLAAAFILYLFALIQAVSCLRQPFYPSWASFTFPFVISAIAAKQTMACLAAIGSPLPWLSYIVTAETVIAVLFVAYTLIRFLLFLTAPVKQSASANTKA